MGLVLWASIYTIRLQHIQVVIQLHNSSQLDWRFDLWELHPQVLCMLIVEQLLLEPCCFLSRH